jgi:hypothetical protein
LEITTQALVRSSKDQLAFTQQLVVASDVITRLAAERHQEDRSSGAGTRGGLHNGHQQGGSNMHSNRSMFGHNREDGVGSTSRAPLPKLSFPKFSGNNPRIWIDKYLDYFQNFNIPESMWTTVASLHMEDNIAKWL